MYKRQVPGGRGHRVLGPLGIREDPDWPVGGDHVALATVHPHNPPEPPVGRYGTAGPAVVVKVKGH